MDLGPPEVEDSMTTAPETGREKHTRINSWRWYCQTQLLVSTHHFDLWSVVEIWLGLHPHGLIVSKPQTTTQYFPFFVTVPAKLMRSHRISPHPQGAGTV